MLAWQEQALAIWKVVMASLIVGGTPVMAIHATHPPMFGVKLPKD